MEEIVIIGICLVLNGLFSCFEMAFVTVTKAQLRQMAKKGTKAASRILQLRENPERTLSVIQVGITLVGMVSAAVGGAGAEEVFAPAIESAFGISENKAEAVAIALVVIPLTFLSVVLGELVPKSIALRDPRWVTVKGASWISLADKAFSPLVRVLEGSTKLIMMLFPRRKSMMAADPAYTALNRAKLKTRCCPGAKSVFLIAATHLAMFHERSSPQVILGCR